LSEPLGVGIIGAGPVTQAIHLPVLAGLADRFRVRRVMDVDAALAGEVAARAGAAASTDAEEVLATTAEDAARIAGAAAATRVPVLAGTMHAYDPAYAMARRNWGDLPEHATLLRSVIYLPANDLMVASSTDPAMPPAPAEPAAPAGAPHPPTMRDAILGLAMHAIPLIREFVPDTGDVRFARMLKPWGYSVTLSSGDRAVQLIGLMPGRWAPDWTLRARGNNQELSVCFPPSYVLAGSATAELNSNGHRSSWHYPDNGYQAEWAHLADVAQGRAEPLISMADAVSDLTYATDLADQATAAEIAQAQTTAERQP
jgi:myo-inositol 2-dehydrogenase/D-chiro-inositol 1-dehydrogenase